MKAIFKNLLAVVCLITFTDNTNAQQVASHTGKLNMGKVEPYEMQVTYNKTSHLIFPAAIRYVDLGSEYLIAGKAEDAENVLRIKAAVRDFEEETNLRCHLIVDNSSSMHYPELKSNQPFYEKKIGFAVLASAVLMNILKKSFEILTPKTNFNLKK